MDQEVFERQASGFPSGLLASARSPIDIIADIIPRGDGCRPQRKRVLFVDDSLGGGFDLPDVANARFITRAIIAAIRRYLRAGKSPKEIAVLTKEPYKNIQMIIYRYPVVHRDFVETYFLRNPHKTDLPRKMANSLREV
jgi:hypothetical protein